MKLFFRNFGSGRPLIILHGLLGMSDNWVTLGKKLAENYTVYLPDLRNHGQSTHSMEFSYEAMANDLLEFIRDHQIENPVLAGHSMGGKVAMLFALNHPELIIGLIVVDISPVAYDNHDYHFDIVSAMMSVNMNAVHTREEVSEVLERSIPDEVTRLFIMKNLHRKAAHQFEWRINLNAISENLSKMVGSTASDKIFNKPAIFIRGSESDYILEDHIPLIKKMFPRAEVITIKGAGHWIHAEKPQETLEAFSSFLHQFQS
ncbi:MAG TPA: alpha/beta fold hydrolase [Lentimicrobium sp.]|nr:alpha/beta fold hydrolase [Lentimicrobium sp.]